MRFSVRAKYKNRSMSGIFRYTHTNREIGFFARFLPFLLLGMARLGVVVKTNHKKPQPKSIRQSATFFPSFFSLKEKNIEKKLRKFYYCKVLGRFFFEQKFLKFSIAYRARDVSCHFRMLKSLKYWFLPRENNVFSKFMLEIRSRS